jgi:hypothetical protein
LRGATNELTQALLLYRCCFVSAPSRRGKLRGVGRFIAALMPAAKNKKRKRRDDRANGGDVSFVLGSRRRPGVGQRLKSEED